jgi:hypothetical protein
MIRWQVQHIIFNEIPTVSSFIQKGERDKKRQRFIINCSHSRIIELSCVIWRQIKANVTAESAVIILDEAT